MSEMYQNYMEISLVRGKGFFKKREARENSEGHDLTHNQEIEMSEK